MILNFGKIYVPVRGNGKGKKGGERKRYAARSATLKRLIKTKELCYGCTPGTSRGHAASGLYPEIRFSR